MTKEEKRGIIASVLGVLALSIIIALFQGSNNSSVVFNQTPQSHRASVTAKSTLSQTVVIENLVDGTPLPIEGEIAIKARVQVDEIQSIAIFLGQKTVKTCTKTSDCLYVWSISANTAPGPHSITAKAEDKKGTVSSTSITVFK
ncbi:MAG: hypothetical protein A3I07_02180 [Candidatus Doudnabacteria bacterium RIFCSPLOWO2_02_FULL_42_9]|uniref:Bacterial Ig-like domain-containing protein n=1 Tax=Candidatus Doudnabacteria bacterium RIFCSPHIGHO2_01_FULL_41_86 TaxID=1817821 RepID=A0A1F5N894_9BACT|nr:MAG: hypothetical protein A2717_04270 [Candidatus Doudnabacteria bacterium RIFCSPHIGHO2_01_FULL_41_86]OGE75316.1 MAG: hypothetical protein A3K07_00805 [Candidatus Doudnabacteria bacterium RIFCSPHIGHO2_01_43_10]OGE85842.1 MAG: hypothetical protein A3E28_03615 [Candidatus Doudnabacteria bacterium RIFCSPHIGHO2_12_FULL_42_22]OGE87336.1 MAG: hypothetical protein A3C49_01235 [Candidatus Doudnabacteria bacterium RIFCSPHIGHO2_02_FULL_42_25]OGE92174.1 MAG: hypothetical protein A2895_01110 [Candidatus